MAVVFDATVLIDLFNSRVKGDRRARLDGLVDALTAGRIKVLIPTPALSELLIHAGKARDEYYRILSRTSPYQIAAFDAKASMECALQLEQALTRRQQAAITKTKLKFDWQIVSIAITRGATAIYSDDEDIARCGKHAGVSVQAIDSLPIPASKRQQRLPIDPEH